MVTRLDGTGGAESIAIMLTEEPSIQVSYSHSMPVETSLAHVGPVILVDIVFAVNGLLRHHWLRERTRSSFIRNAWQAVSQMLSGGTRPILQRGGRDD